MIKIGAFFQTVENAPITHETFDEGYTFEFIIKLMMILVDGAVFLVSVVSPNKMD